MVTSRREASAELQTRDLDSTRKKLAREASEVDRLRAAIAKTREELSLRTKDHAVEVRKLEARTKQLNQKETGLNGESQRITQDHHELGQRGVDLSKLDDSLRKKKSEIDAALETPGLIDHKTM